MDLETALSRPVQLDCRKEILRGALLRRRAELRKSWKYFISTECLNSLGPLAPEVESFLSEQGSTHDWRLAATFTWINCDASFSDCLCSIALAGKVDRKSTRLNSSHLVISYAVFCLKKKKKKIETDLHVE